MTFVLCHDIFIFMKTIYCVRHAESEGNISVIRHDATSPLSETGKKQAKLIAKRFENISIDKIFASPYERTKHTAQEINKVLKKPIEFYDSIVEISRPSFMVGKEKDSKEVLEVMDQIRDNFNNPEWRHSDEETFQDLKSRGLKVLKFLEVQPEEKILLVSHGVFLRVIIGCVIFGDSLTSQEFWKLFVGTTIQNTGVTVFEQTKWNPTDKPYWRLITWNDHAHL